MKVRVKKNFIFEGTVRKTGEIFDMPTNDALDYERRGWLATPKNPQAKPMPANFAKPLPLDAKKK